MFCLRQQRTERRSGCFEPEQNPQRALVQDGINWHFNTPAASHQGGIWERLICCVRSALPSVLKQQIVDDEALQTVFCEAEAILNDRPITQVCDDPDDLEALHQITS